MDSTEILIRLRQIMHTINTESKRIDKHYGVSIPQALSLKFLRNCPQFQTSQNELRSFLKLNSSTMNGIVERLEKKGLIARMPKMGDKRKVQIVLTAKGDQLISSIPPLLHDRLDKNLGKLDTEAKKQMDFLLVQLARLMEIETVTPENG